MDGQLLVGLTSLQLVWVDDTLLCGCLSEQTKVEVTNLFLTDLWTISEVRGIYIYASLSRPRTTQYTTQWHCHVLFTIIALLAQA